MTEKANLVKKTLKEKRAESDTRIIEAAIKCFGRNGYTNTSLSDIAKGASVTAGLISQRYGTKKNLFCVAFNTIISEYFTGIDPAASPRECLIAILAMIRNISDNHSDAFKFSVMINSSTDIPSDAYHDYMHQIINQPNIFRILSLAQEMGVIPSGDLDVFLSLFISNVLHHIWLCKRYNIDIPDDRYFLDGIHFVDRENDRYRNDYINEQIVDIFCKEFQTVWLVNVSDLTMKTFSTDSQKSIPNSVSTALKMNSYDSARKWYVENCVAEYSKDRVYEQSNIGFVLSKLEDGNSFYIEYERILNNVINYNQLYYDKIINPSTKEIEYVVCGFRNIDYTRMSGNDDLTGLLTRQRFFENAGKMLNEYPDKQFDLVISDIVDFKKINETYGADVADSILKWHSSYLATLVNDNLIIGRYGGDQMVLFGTHESILTCLSDEYRDRFIVAEKENGLPSINIKYGIYLNVKRDQSIISTCDKAHIALNSIKRHYSKEIAYYNEEIKSHINKQRRIEESMYKSLENGDFKVYYQPKHDAKTGQLVGAEALVRWIHPEYGFMNPGDFIPLFEQNGFIVENDRFVWKRTCENLRRWIDKGIKTVPISVNASKLTMANSDITKNMHEVINAYNLSPNQLHVEITESLMSDNTDDLVDKLSQIRALGFKVELDDFGTGYSSLNILSSIPLDVVKLDMSFMKQFGDNKRLMVLESCIDLAKKLGFETISEGVEIKEQQELLDKLGVDIIQGYYYSRPLPEDEFEAYLIENLS